MSDDSSNVQAPARSVIPGWALALVAVAATIFLYFFAQLVGSFAVSIYPLAVHMTHEQAVAWLASSVDAQFAYGLLADGVLLGGVWLVLKRLGWSWKTIGFRSPTIAQLTIGVLSVVPYLLLSIIVTSIIKAFVPALNVDQKQELGFESVHGLSQQVLTFLSLVVLPPIAEEAVMRGFLFTGLKRAMPWTLAGLIVSGLFGAAHLAEGGDAGLLWVGAIDTFVLSVVLVILREKTGNLWAGIMLHAAKNCLAFIRIFIIGGL